ncbi:membrane lipoprotein lipid attachment site-containing protein [Arenibacter echinorum]|uniref:Lipoprotein n=1 Tax=Arenibacter echinorum TaxID=440515 RepID=A0A327QZH7_9FLAO|nr:membrane lipoprotein lipid attachment site-containing protein [Arenibacter echinorum]RAJ09054.1 hypothetical protein LV92_03272 [Arenibacter echinorum]
MKKIVFTLLLGLMLAACQAQDDRSKSKVELVDKNTDSITVDKPKISWKVNKKYDEEGKVVGYDSIYSYSYSNINNLPKQMNLDSIIGSMKFFPHGKISSLMEDQNLGQFMDMDSLMNGSQYFNDFFESQRNNNFSDIRKLFQQMDSLQNMMMEKHRNFLPEDKEERSKI